MSTLYLVDMFANPVASAKILDVRSGTSAPCNGNIVVRVPDSISVQNPTSVADLTTKKHAAMLAYYAGYANLAFDDLTDLLSVDLTAPGVMGSFGERNIVGIYPGGFFQTDPIALVGPAPTQAIITWETYSVTLTDPATGLVVTTYVEEPSSSANFLCSVSFNNGANYYPTTDGALLNIPVLGQGTQFILRLQNSTSAPSRPIRVGSWAAVY